MRRLFGRWWVSRKEYEALRENRDHWVREADFLAAAVNRLTDRLAERMGIR